MYKLTKDVLQLRLRLRASDVQKFALTVFQFVNVASC